MGVSYCSIKLDQNSSTCTLICLQGNPAREEEGNLKSVAAALDFFGDGVAVEEDRAGRKREKPDPEKRCLGKRKRERGSSTMGEGSVMPWMVPPIEVHSFRRI